MSKVVIIDYGAGNVKSVQFACQRLGVSAELSSEAETIASADKLIFPGQGEASSAMKALKRQGLDTVIQKARQPFLGVCLGMQLMCASSEENDARGLGIFPLSVKRFDKSAVKTPHIGWNKIERLESPLFDGLSASEYVYFAHSYYVPTSSWTTAQTDYPNAFSAALQKDNFYGCQFHPEKSGTVGQKILENFLKR